MNAVTAQATLSNATITLTIQHTETIHGIDRADINGTRPVRTTGIFPYSTAGDLVLNDYEAALVGLVEYRVSVGTETLVVRSTLETAQGQNPRFLAPTVPQYSQAVETVLAYEEEQEWTTTIHEAIDRPDPLVNLGTMRTRQGTLEIFANTYQETEALKAMLTRAGVVFYRQAEHQGQDFYFVPTRLRAQADPETGTWTVTLGFVEVLYPLVNLRPVSGWTFAALAAEETTFSSTAKHYDSFAALRIGDRS